jgi:hypothetical protein
MATWTDVIGIMKGVKGAEREGGARKWRVKDKLAAWERPLRESDLEALGDEAPEGPILGVRVPLEVKEALLATGKKAYFTTPHFDGYPAILVHLPSIKAAELRKLLVTACEQRAQAKRTRTR